MQKSFLMLLLLISAVNLILTIKILNNLKRASRAVFNGESADKNSKVSFKSSAEQSKDIINNFKEKALKPEHNSPMDSSQTSEEPDAGKINRIPTRKQSQIADITSKQKVINEEFVKDKSATSLEGIALRWWDRNLEILEKYLEDPQKVSSLGKDIPDISSLEFDSNQNMVYISIREFKDKDCRIVVPLLYAPLRGNFNYFDGASITGQVEKIRKPAVLKELDKEMSYFSIIAKGELECG